MYKRQITLYQQLHNTHLAPTNVTVVSWEDLLRESVNINKILPTWLQIVGLALILMALFFLFKYLNSIVCCDAVKGASYRRASGSASRFKRWMNKRADYFKTIDSQNQSQSASFRQTYHRPSQDTVPVHFNRASDRAFIGEETERDRQAQIDNLNLAYQAENARIRHQGIFPAAQLAPEHEDHIYVTIEEGLNASSNSMYTLPTATPRTHRYNTRSSTQKLIPPESGPQEPTAPATLPARSIGFQL